jgi:phthalate 4,5-cis-dihydrodiol dehydrogenase
MTNSSNDVKPETNRAAGRRMKVAVAGLGQGARDVLTAMEHEPHLELMAAADVRQSAREAFETRYNGRAYDTVEGLASDPDVEVIWISTPNQFHCEHALIAASHGKHVVVEKPMAVSLDEAKQMVAASEKYGTKLLCGHTASLMAAYQAMRDVVRSGELGKLCAINIWSYTDWMLRPRMAQELDLELGGGVPYRQGPHQVDTVRLLGGGKVRSVRAMTGQWLPQRPAPGYYVAYIEFEDGVPATIVHNGYGYFSTFELVPWAGEWPMGPGARLRKALKSGADASVQDAAAKEQTRIGGAQTLEEQDERFAALRGGALNPGFQPDLGIVIVSCENGDIRQSPNGLWIYDDDGRREVLVQGLQDERMAELNEMYDAVIEGRPVRHDGRWGMATLEVVLGIMQSGKERREVFMSHQSDGY